jgi:DNA-binding protein HU-beta
VKKPATKARKGINPFTKEEITFKAKPASKKVRALPLKNLKSFVN